jgi:hypothetical protein
MIVEGSEGIDVCFMDILPLAKISKQDHCCPKQERNGKRMLIFLDLATTKTVFCKLCLLFGVLYSNQLR